jgi:dolichyl-diphosphooligosaccharide--protein glycosyltransferase
MHSEQFAGRGSRAAFLAILLVAAAIRFSTFGAVFQGGGVYLDGPDAYYHLHRAFLTVKTWPSTPQTDAFLNAPDGGRVSWPPLFDFVLATLALPWGAAARRALEVIGALLPPILGVMHVVMVRAIVRRIAGEGASLAAALAAAVIPGAVRYTMVGALDHDPWFELALLLSVFAIVDAVTRERTGRATLLLGAALVMGTLGWTGAPLQVAIVVFVAIAASLAQRDRAFAVGSVLATGSAIAAIVVAPFVEASVWTRAEAFTFEGLSLLHDTALIGAAFCGAAIALGARRSLRGAPMQLGIAIAAAIALVPLGPQSLAWFIRAFRYAAGDADILALVSEARPLYSLFGELDFRPVVTRLGLLPLWCGAGLAVALWRRESRPAAALVAPWAAIALFLAMRHSRFTFTAALALATAAGLAWLVTPRRFRVAALAISLLPALPAYVSVPGFEGQNLLARGSLVRRLEIDSVARAIGASRGEGAVLAPWSYGHWIIWYAERPVVLSPMLSVGQPGFRDGMAFFFIEDVEAAVAYMRAHGVRWLVVTPELGSVASRARISGVDGTRYLNAAGVPDARKYLRTISARLAYFGPGALRIGGERLAPIPMREIARSRAMLPTPFGGWAPSLRVYVLDAWTTDNAPAELRQ